MTDQQGAAQRIPKMKVRTMASDLKSIQETGGGAPKGYIPQTGGAPAVPASAPAPTAQPQAPQQQPQPPAGQPQPPTPTPPSPAAPAPPAQSPQTAQVPAPAKKNSKTILAVLAIFLAFVFGIIIYFALQLLLP